MVVPAARRNGVPEQVVTASFRAVTGVDGGRLVLSALCVKRVADLRVRARSRTHRCSVARVSRVGIEHGKPLAVRAHCGKDIGKELRREKERRLIAVTGYGQLDDQQRARAAGFDDHLVKPVDLPALERALAGIPPAE
jgi:hypothetical protein